MQIENSSIVYNKDYGKGTVIKIKDDNIYVAFDIGQRVFPYPEAFEKEYLTADYYIDIQKEDMNDERLGGLSDKSAEVADTEFLKLLKRDLADKPVTPEPVKQGGYSIKDGAGNRIARIQKQLKNYYCVCDRKESRRAFDYLKPEYEHLPGFKITEGKSKPWKRFYFERYKDIISFLRAVIDESMASK